MPRLIVTADDFGSGPGRNAGIVEAFRAGIVTGATLLANGPAFSDAVCRAHACAIPVGVHLNLSEGRPLAGPVAGLTGADGSFPGKEAARAILAAGSFDRAAALRELQAQIARVAASALPPTHLDSHQHAALFPSVTPLVIAAARAAGLAAVRLPAPAEPPRDDPPGNLGAELALYRRLAPACAAAFRHAGLRTPQGLYGMPLLNRLDEAALLAVLSSLPAGTWELMTHPGHPDPGHPFAGAARSRELQALIAPAVRARIAAAGIELLSYRDLACAS